MTLKRNALSMALGLGLRLMIMAFYFAMMTRSLGVSNYGEFVGVVALVAIFFPFASLGSGQIMIRDVSRNRHSFGSSFGRAISTTIITSILLCSLVLYASHYFMPKGVPLALIGAVALADLLGLSLLTLAGQAFQAIQKLHWTAAINVCLSLCRLSFAIPFLRLHHHPSALDWGYLYCSSTLLAATMSIVGVLFLVGRPQLQLPSRSLINEGIYFSVSLSAQTIYNDIDKTMLSRLSTLTATGIYGAAYRLIDVAYAPILAILYATYPEFFRKGTCGMLATLNLAGWALTNVMLYAIPATVLLITCSGLVPIVLGHEYSASVLALRWLSLLLPIKAVHGIFSDTLTGAGYQQVRSMIQVCVAVFNVTLNLWIIPHYSWRGAILSSILSDSLLAIAVGAAVYILVGHDRHRLAVI